MAVSVLLHPEKLIFSPKPTFSWTGFGLVWFGFCFDLSLDLLKENGFEKLETEFKSWADDLEFYCWKFVWLQIDAPSIILIRQEPVMILLTSTGFLSSNR